MTLVFCWHERSFGRDFITSIADTRAATQVSEVLWEPLNETTTKLFGLDVKCHTVKGLGLEHYELPEPFFQTQIGLAFAGYCFEAQSIIALLRRCLLRLVQLDGGNNSRPTPEGYAKLLDAIGTKYFAGHGSKATHSVSFLVFGFLNGKPWMVEWSYKAGKGAVHKVHNPMSSDEIYSIGDEGQNANTQTALKAMRSAISRHRSKLRADDASSLKLEEARHDVADKKGIEQTALLSLEDEFKKTVGGILQKMEVKPIGEQAFVDFCKDQQEDILDNLPMVGANLGYVPVNEMMGMGHSTNSSNSEEAT